MERIYTSECATKIGESVMLSGWLETVRDHGKVIFLMLRDRRSVIQCVSVGKGSELNQGDVVQIVGKVKERPENMRNSNIDTGSVEIEVESYEILNKSKELPIPINGDGKDVNEEMRLKYRYVDMRRERMRKIMKLRSDYVKALRNQLDKYDFLEVETPILTKSTKEGSRDFIVPSRHHPGKFYALPQSPQQYKQLLMTAGVERYFQFARCIRDEDLRADRGYEHTQLDMELSFMSQEQIMQMIETIIKGAVKEVGGKLKDEVFPVIEYKDAIEKYGDDKFDLRTAQEKEDGVLAFAWVTKFPFFKKTADADEAEKEDSKSEWVFTHNPFSMPIPEHLEWHMKGENIGEIMTSQYDLVCNGYEVGGGSVRAHRPEILRQTYKIMGYTDVQVEEGVGHMLEAFELGTPPHGGIGLGLDRHVMLLANETSLKETVAFPMTSSGKTAVMEGPSTLSSDQLNDVHISSNDKGTETVEKIRALLDAEGVEYKYMEHAEVRTSEQAAEIRGTQISDGAKAMVLKSKEYMNKFVMVVIPADKMLDLEKVNANLSEEFEIANGKEIEKLTGIQMGGVPPFGRILGIEVYFDAMMYEKSTSAFNCGRKDASIVMKTVDLIKYAQPKKGSEKFDFIQ